MNYITFLFKKRTGWAIVIIIASLFLTVGLPTNVGGFHFETPYTINDVAWRKTIVEGVNIVIAALLFAIYGEFQRGKRGGII